MGKKNKKKPEEKVPPIEVLVLRGRARTEGAAPVHLGTLRSGTHCEERHTLGHFELEIDDGHRVTVESADTLAHAPTVLQVAHWSELEVLPEAAPFRERAPAPHFKAKLSTTTIADGDAVTLRAEVLDSAFEGGTMRDAPELRVTRVRALALAVGDTELPEATRATAKTPDVVPEPRARPATHGWGLVAGGAMTLALALVSVAGLVAAVLASWLPRRVDGLVISASCGLMALALVPMRKGLLFFSRSGPLDRDPSNYGLGMAIGILTWLTMAIVPLIGDEEGNINNVTKIQIMITPIIFVGFAICCALSSVFLALLTARSAQIARVMLGARPHANPPIEGQWGASLGTVTADKPPRVLGELAPIASLIEDEYRSGSNPGFLIETPKLGSFVLETAQTRISVDAADGLFSTTIVVDSPERASSALRRVLRRARVVSVGSHALVVGRMRKTQLLEASGPESLLVFADRTAPVAALRRLLRLRDVSVVALAVLAVVLAVLTVWHPFLGTFQMPESRD